MTSHFLLYPLMAAALITADWRWVLGIWGIRFLIQGFVFFKSMNKLGEKDLFPLFWLWDVWMFFYYLIFISAIWKKPRNQWN
jgi:hypothetical protein